MLAPPNTPQVLPAKLHAELVRVMALPDVRDRALKSGNETQFTLISSVLAATHLESKKLRALAIGSLNRDPLFPEVPTFAEAGFAGLEAVTWVGLFAPAQTPAPIIALLNKEIDRLIREPSIAGNLQKQGIAISGGSPEVLGKLVTSEISRWTAIARKSSISSAAH
jgi:tripartite-type tricarboxylate transporter receptor subunit TctC